MFKDAVPSDESAIQQPIQKQKVRAKGTEQFKSVFDTRNLTGESASQNQEEPKAKGTENSGGLFDPENLRKSSGTDGN